jgi:uroporphyrinogen decarboxylase
MPCHLLSYHGCNHEGYEGGGHDCPVGTRWTDIWGTGWRKEQDDIMGFPWIHPLSEMESIKNYLWPDPMNEQIYNRIYEMKNAYVPADNFLAGFHRDTLWERAHMLVGMENMMAYFHTEPEYAREILHRIMDFQLGIAKHYLEVGVEMVLFGDDLGTQHSLLIGKDLLYEFFVPEYKKLFDLYKKSGVIISFHSCGHIEPLLGVFMELGVDILNPIQANANDLLKMRAQTEYRMTLEGGISTVTLMNGPESKIESTVRDTIRMLGKNGGYFCAPDQYMPFPKENIAAMESAVKKYGVYPLE